jgi:hypothetical protein
MKRFALLFGAALAALSFSGLAQQPPVDANRLADAVTAKAGAEKYVAVSSCMRDGKDATAQVACVLGIALIEVRGQAVAAGPVPAVQVIQAEPRCTGFAQCGFWAVGDALKAAFGFLDRNAAPIASGYFQNRSNQRQAASNEVIAGFQRDQYVATMGAFQSTAQAGFVSNAQIAGLIQAPQPNVTLSGQGVIGNGTYNAPITATRNCNGGTSTTSSGTTASPGGAGGTAQGGNC